MSKKLITEGKLFEGFSTALKGLVGGLFSGKVKKVKWPDSKEARNAAEAVRIIGRGMEVINDYFDKNPEEDKIFLKKLFVVWKNIQNNLMFLKMIFYLL